MSIRGNKWNEFAEQVFRHIEEYTVPQYGDEGEDQITDYSCEDCITMVKKYANRYGTNAREGQQELDFLKMAHYAQCAYDKYRENNDKVETYQFEGKFYQVLSRLYGLVSKNLGKNIKMSITIKDDID